MRQLNISLPIFLLFLKNIYKFPHFFVSEELYILTGVIIIKAFLDKPCMISADHMIQRYRVYVKIHMVCPLP